MDTLTSLDYVVFFALQFLTIVIVIFSFRFKEKSTLIDFILMGRRLTLPLFVATLVATWYGGIMGVSQIAYNDGIYNFIIQGAFWYLTYILFALFMVDKIRETSPLTLPDLIETHFGKKARFVINFYNFLNILPIVYITSLGLLLKMFFDIPFVLGMIYGGAFVFIYSLFGGFKAIVISDFFQFILMFTSIVFVFLYSYTSYGVSPLQNLPTRMYDLDGGHGLLATLSWGLIALTTLVNPAFYQRCFAASSTSVAKKGIFISTIIWFIFDISLTLGAMYASSLNPGYPQDGYIRYAIGILPEGFKGYFLAGVFATVLSTLDSYLFIAGTTLSYDFKIFKNMKSYHHHLGVFISLVLAILVGSYFDGDIKRIWKIFGSISAASLLAPISLKLLFNFKISEKRFMLSLLLSTFVTLISSFMGLKNEAIYLGVLTSALVISLRKQNLVRKKNKVV